MTARDLLESPAVVDDDRAVVHEPVLSRAAAVEVAPGDCQLGGVIDGVQSVAGRVRAHVDEVLAGRERTTVDPAADLACAGDDPKWSPSPRIEIDKRRPVAQERTLKLKRLPRKDSVACLSNAKTMSTSSPLAGLSISSPSRSK